MIALSGAAPASSTAGKLAPFHCRSDSGKKEDPGPARHALGNRALVGAEHRVRTGDLRLGKALTKMCKAMQRESTLRNFSRRPALLTRRLCQPMQQDAARLLTQD